MVTRRRRRRSPGAIEQPAWSQPVSRINPIEPLDPEQIELIHRASLQILTATGMRIMDPGARERLARAGCRVDDQQVYFDPELVEETVALSPDSFLLRARNPAKDLMVGGNHMIFTAIGGPAFCSDLDRGRRAGTFAEQCEFLRLIGSLDILHQEGGGPFEALDLPAATRHLDLLAALARILDKNWQGIALGRERTLDSIEIAARALGTDRDGLLENPAVLAIVNTNSPLALDVPMAEGLMTLADAGQAVCVTPFTLAGAMAPVTLAGALTLQNAEVLAGVTLAQVVRPGTPVVYGSFTSNVDMRTGSPAFGTPEYVKAAQAGGQLARRYGLPYRSSSTTGSSVADAQATYESAMSLWGAITGGVNLLNHAAGWLEGGLTASYEKLVIDAEMLRMLAASLEPVVVDDTEIGLGAIDDVGPGGHFFASPHTLERYESAFYRPLVSDWSNYEAWVESGRRDATERANDIWKRLVAGYEDPPLPAGSGEAIDEYVARRKQELTA